MIATTLAGRYRIEAQIGIGGMGVVYRARDEKLQRDVAVKVIAPHLVRQEAARKRFAREAQALAGLSHPNIVTIYDLVEDAETETVLLIMELLQGASLRERMVEGSPPAFSHVALPLCRALECAHSRNILHRDIKPENIYVCQDGTLKLMDFGLARLVGSGSKNQSSTVAGTVSYMSPEQLRGEPLDARSDLYGVGVVFYELLAGTTPFVGDNPATVLLKHLTEPPPPLADLLPALLPALEAVVMRLLVKEPEGRYASAEQLCAALNETDPATGKPIVTLADAWQLDGNTRQAAQTRAAAPITQPVTASLTDLPPLTNGEDTPAPPAGSRRRARLPFLIGGVALVGMAAAGGLFLNRRGTSSDSAAGAVGASLPAPVSKPADVGKPAPLSLLDAIPHTPVPPLTSPAAGETRAKIETGAKPVPEGKPATKQTAEKTAHAKKATVQIAGMKTPTHTAPVALDSREAKEIAASLHSLQSEVSRLQKERDALKHTAATGDKTPSTPATSPAPARPGSAFNSKGGAAAPPTSSHSGGSNAASLSPLPPAVSMDTLSQRPTGRRRAPQLRMRATLNLANQTLRLALSNSEECAVTFYVTQGDATVLRQVGTANTFLPIAKWPQSTSLVLNLGADAATVTHVFALASPSPLFGLPPTLNLPQTVMASMPGEQMPGPLRTQFAGIVRDHLGLALQLNDVKTEGHPLRSREFSVRVVNLQAQSRRPAHP